MSDSRPKQSRRNDLERKVLYHDIATRLIDRQSHERICHECQISTATLNRITKDPEFREVFDEIHRRIMDPVEEALRNERLALEDRIQHMSQRALTTLAQVMERFIKGQTDPSMPRSTAASAVKAASEVLSRNPRTAAMLREHLTGSQTLTLDEDTARTIGKVIADTFGDTRIIDVTPAEKDRDDNHDAAQRGDP